MIVYDYLNTPVEVNLPDRPISSIFVQILSGDETGTVAFEDGTAVHFDASNHRIYGFFGGSYVVCKSKVKEWLAFSPTPGETASYERGRMNWEEEEMNIPDCYDPIYQAERLAAEIDKRLEAALTCALCGDTIQPGQRYHTTEDKAVCRFCADEIAKNVFILEEEQ